MQLDLTDRIAAFSHPGIFFIGLGLGDFGSLTVDALAALHACTRIFMDNYTNFFQQSIIQAIETATNKHIELLQRSQLEDEATILLSSAQKIPTALLVSGDPFIATTHTTLREQAIKEKIAVHIINNASIFSTAASRAGLWAYKFGKTPTIPFPRARSQYPYDVLKNNKDIGCHTLVLLDIDVIQKRFVDITTAINELEALEAQYQLNILNRETLLIGMAKLGTQDEKIIAGSMSLIKGYPWKDFGPPQSLIVCANLHFAEKETLNVLFNLHLE